MISFSVPPTFMFYVPDAGNVTFLGIYQQNPEPWKNHPMTNVPVPSTSVPSSVPRGAWTLGPWPPLRPDVAGQGRNGQGETGGGHVCPPLPPPQRAIRSTRCMIHSYDNRTTFTVDNVNGQVACTWSPSSHRAFLKDSGTPVPWTAGMVRTVIPAGSRGLFFRSTPLVWPSWDGWKVMEEISFENSEESLSSYSSLPSYSATS
ncbi:hypothetical protein BGX20_008307 [Mortierella sp. AD010]|nr:hypothetical protein BGX20_008307 [Mortierella sp. AD010]